jgi:hypothetical protein
MSELTGLIGLLLWIAAALAVWAFIRGGTR